MKLDKDKSIDKYLKKLSKQGYGYYANPTYRDLLMDALRQEKMYVENCADFPKDLSAEASNRRIRNYIRRNRHKYWGK